jgi:hypothetical protein
VSLGARFGDLARKQVRKASHYFSGDVKILDGDISCEICRIIEDMGFGPPSVRIANSQLAPTISKKKGTVISFCV